MLQNELCDIRFGIFFKSIEKGKNKLVVRLGTIENEKFMYPFSKKNVVSENKTKWQKIEMAINCKSSIIVQMTL